MGKKKVEFRECSYCGDFALTLDHVIPVSYMRSAKRGTGYVSQRETQAVPCCVECNSLLSTIALFSVSERAGYLSQRLATRHKKLLSSPSWSKEQILELDGRLKSFVTAKQSEKSRIIERIRHCLLIASLPELSLEQIWEAHHKGLTLAEYISGIELNA